MRPLTPPAAPPAGTASADRPHRDRARDEPVTCHRRSGVDQQPRHLGRARVELHGDVDARRVIGHVGPVRPHGRGPSHRVGEQQRATSVDKRIVERVAWCVPVPRSEGRVTRLTLLPSRGRHPIQGPLLEVAPERVIGPAFVAGHEFLRVGKLVRGRNRRDRCRVVLEPVDVADDPRQRLEDRLARLRHGHGDRRRPARLTYDAHVEIDDVEARHAQEVARKRGRSSQGCPRAGGPQRDDGEVSAVRPPDLPVPRQPCPVVPVGPFDRSVDRSVDRQVTHEVILTRGAGRAPGITGQGSCPRPPGPAEPPSPSSGGVRRGARARSGP